MGETPTLEETEEHIDLWSENKELVPETSSEDTSSWGIWIKSEEIAEELGKPASWNGDYIQWPSRYDRRESINDTAMKYREAAEKAKAAGDLKEYARLIDLANEFMAQIPNLDDDWVLERYINKRG